MSKLKCLLAMDERAQIESNWYFTIENDERKSEKCTWNYSQHTRQQVKRGMLKSCCFQIVGFFFVCVCFSERSTCVVFVCLCVFSSSSSFFMGKKVNAVLFNASRKHYLSLSPPKGGRGCLMSPPCLESQGCHLIPLCYLLSCSSA